jgi:hypothetical protein
VARRFQILNIFAPTNYSTMNFQEILAPIEDFFMWTFGFLEAGENMVNYLLIAIIALALVYWTIKLAGFQKDEALNR